MAPIRRRRLLALRNLADRPGTPAEGRAARKKLEEFELRENADDPWVWFREYLVTKDIAVLYRAIECIEQSSKPKPRKQRRKLKGNMDANELVSRIKGTYPEMIELSTDLYNRISAWVDEYEDPKAPVVEVPKPHGHATDKPYACNSIACGIIGSHTQDCLASRAERLANDARRR